MIGMCSFSPLLVFGWHLLLEPCTGSPHVVVSLSIAISDSPHVVLFISIVISDSLCVSLSLWIETTVTDCN